MDSDHELDIVEQAERQAQLDDNEEPQEVQREYTEDEAQEVQADEDGDNENGERVVVKPKRVVRNPQPKLNVDTLKGPRGLTALPDLFAKQKFKGKGHEETDLNVLLKTYEYWCHRLFPKLRFDQCVDKIETLGNKKPVVTYIKRIRMGILDEPQENLIHSDDDEVVATPQQQQQIDSVESRFDDLTQRAAQPKTQLTESQVEMIRANKERALRLRQDRLRRIQQQAEAKLGVSNVLPSTESQEIVDESVNVSTIEKQLQDTIQVGGDTQEEGQAMDVVTNPSKGAKEFSLMDDDDDFDMLSSHLVIDTDKGIITQTQRTGDAKDTMESSQSQDLFATSPMEEGNDLEKNNEDCDEPEEGEVGIDDLLNDLDTNAMADEVDTDKHQGKENELQNLVLEDKEEQIPKGDLSNNVVDSSL